MARWAGTGIFRKLVCRQRFLRAASREAKGEILVPLIAPGSLMVTNADAVRASNGASRKDADRLDVQYELTL